jgi:hypothetical protein
LLLCITLLAYAEGNTFTRVRYNGGSVPSKVDPKDWDNKLTVTPDAITLEYSTSESKNAGILLQGDKDNYRAILVALQGVTGAPVSVGEKDREFILVGLTTSVTKDSGEGNAADRCKTQWRLRLS